jgi:hypothetical protein
MMFIRVTETGEERADGLKRVLIQTYEVGTKGRLSRILGSHGGEYEDGCLLGCSAALMMEATRTSETFVNFYQTTRRYNPEDSHLRDGYIT